MALFRMLCINFQNSIPSLKKLMVRLIWAQYVVMLGICGVYLYAISYYGSSDTYDFCRGFTTKMAHVLMKKTDQEIQYGKGISHAIILFAQSFVVLEFVCYLVIYRSLGEKNKTLLNIVQEDVLRARAKKNMITLTGQALTFVVEVTYSILMQVVLHFGTLGGFFGPGALPCFALGAMGAISASQVLASPELRRFVQGLD